MAWPPPSPAPAAAASSHGLPVYTPTLPGFHVSTATATDTRLRELETGRSKMQTQLNRVQSDSATMWQDQQNLEAALKKQGDALTTVREQLQDFAGELQACRQVIATLKSELATVTDKQTALQVTVEELQARRLSGRRRAAPARFGFESLKP